MYSRVVEETINLVLTRARSEAEIASIATHTHRLSHLSSDIAAASAVPNASAPAVTCTIRDVPGPAVVLTKLTYARGSARVSVNHLGLGAGRTFAVTGPNGSGKSTLFSIITGCSRSESLDTGKPHHPATALGHNIRISDRDSAVALQTADVVELTQRSFCPLHIRPIDWVLQPFDALAPEHRPTVDRVLELFGELRVFGNTSVTADDLSRERADWYYFPFGGLGRAGGAKGKQIVPPLIFIL